MNNSSTNFVADKSHSPFLTHNEMSDNITLNNFTQQNTNNSNYSNETVLYQGMIFTTWQQAFDIIESWAKQQGFNVIYNRVERKSDGTFRKRTVQCEHQGNYVTKSNGKQTKTKRIGCT